MAREGSVRHAAEPDECPFHRPFPADFAECPAFLQSEYVGLDLQHRPLAPVWTCQNLEVAQHGDRPGAHYGRCRLGTSADRLAWLKRVQSGRLTAVLDTRREFNREFHEMTVRLWSAKGRALQAPADLAARLELTAIAEQYKTACDAFFEQRRNVFRDAGIPLGPAQRLARGMVDRMIASRSADASAAIPEEELSDFPPALRFFLEPGAGASEGEL